MGFIFSCAVHLISIFYPPKSLQISPDKKSMFTVHCNLTALASINKQ